jgi:hypothetical protein
MSYHTTTLKILHTTILSLVLVPTETHATTLNHFLTFLAHRKFYRQDPFDPVFFIKFHFYLFTTPQNQKLATIFKSYKKSSNLASPSSHPSTMPSLLQPASNILLLISSPYFPKTPLLISFQKSHP